MNFCPNDTEEIHIQENEFKSETQQKNSTVSERLLLETSSEQKGLPHSSVVPPFVIIVFCCYKNSTDTPRRKYFNDTSAESKHPVSDAIAAL